jgi:Protein of unknown function (DUF1549)/Protein of unknown function (DUF1553)
MNRTIRAIRALAVVVAVLGVRVPLPADEPLPPNRPIPEVIDHYVGLKLKQNNITPAPQADDATLVRRLALDLAGRIPTAAEARAYLGAKDSDKRTILINRLMTSPDYVRHAATEFDTMLRCNNPPPVPSLRTYLLVALGENRPWDQMFRELMGVDSDPTRPDQFVLGRLGNLDLLTRDVSSVFFGVNIMCAQCHKHPYVSSITQDYYYGMKAFFSHSINFQGRVWERQYAKRVEYKAKNGEMRQPKPTFVNGKVLVEPKTDSDHSKLIQEEDQRLAQLNKNFAKNGGYPPKPPFSYREQLINVALEPTEREVFARSIVNRLWYRFHGYGLVMRVDQMHAKNRPSHPDLLQWLARDFIAHHYDLRRLVQGLVSSQTYSLSSRWEQGDAPLPKWFAVANPRPLTPMQFGLSQILASKPDVLAANLPVDLRDKQLEKLEAEARRVFGQVIEEPQEGMQINVTEALKLSNDPLLLKLLGDGLVSQLLNISDRDRQIETAVWTVLSRPPTDDERKVLGDYLIRREHNNAPEQPRPTQTRNALKQMVWALLASAEFRFNH